MRGVIHPASTSRSYKLKFIPTIFLLCIISSSLADVTINTNKDRSENKCVISIPPSSLGLNAFYKKYCLSNGVILTSSLRVGDDALTQTWYIVNNMLYNVKKDVVMRMISNKVRIVIISRNESTTDIPEYSNLDTNFPLNNGESWNIRSRGLGATMSIPVSSGAEENIMCLPGDRYVGENIFVHEFAHTILNLGVEPVDHNFRNRLLSIYQSAMANKLWQKTYAAESPDEYWAEGVQDYFNVNIMSIPSNGVHNQTSTRSALRKYDPKLFGIIQEVFGEREFTPMCPKQGVAR